VNYPRLALRVFFLLVFVNLTGCFSARDIDIEAFLKPHQVNTTADNYILQPPDEVEVHFVGIPEINIQRQRIRPDGKISFEDFGEVEAAGKTPREVAEILEEKAKDLYTLTEKEHIDVRVAAYSSHLVYVLGEVSNPGPRVYTGRDTVFTALSMAHPEVTAWKNQIQVIRPSSDKDIKPKIFRVKYKDMMERGDLSKDVLLQEGDIIYVPPTILASVAMVIEEFTRPIGRALAPAVSVSRISMAGGIL